MAAGNFWPLILAIYCLKTSPLAAETTEIQEEEGVLVLTQQNFDEALATHKFMLIEFYAPWCAYCKALKPEYEQAAKTLLAEGSTIRLGKVDITVEKELSEHFNIKNYPTIKFFNNVSVEDYKAGRTANEIVVWLKKKTGQPTEIISSVAELRRFLQTYNVTVVGVFTNDTDSLAKKVKFDQASAESDLPFASVDVAEDDLYAELELSKGSTALLMYKKAEADVDVGQARIQYRGSEWHSEAILHWVRKYELPTVLEFSPVTARKIFASDIKIHTLLFVRKSNAEFGSLRSQFGKAAKQLKGRSLFIVVDVEDAENGKVLDFFGVTMDQIPLVSTVIMDESTTKFRMPKGPIETASIVAFFEDVIADRAQPYRLSDQLPVDWNARPVKVLVASNYDAITKDKTKNVLVDLYAPWCEHCKALASVWEQLGELFQHRDDLLIAKMDASKNEVEGLTIQSFPSIRWYPKDGDQFVEYGGDRSIDALKRFVESNGQQVISEYIGELDSETEGFDEEGHQLPHSDDQVSSKSAQRNEL